MTYAVVVNQQYVLLCERLFAYVTFVGPVRIQVFLEWIIYTFVFTWNNKEKNQSTTNNYVWRAHNSYPHKWYCHFWDWHNCYLTLLIKSKLILVNFGNLNYWYWAQFTLTLLKFDISDLQNDWHLHLLIFGIIGISCFWFLELFIFSMSDIKHDWYRAWLT